MKRIIYVIILIFTILSCSNKNFSKEYEQFKTEIEDKIVDMQLYEEDYDKAIDIFSVKYKGKNVKDYIEEVEKNNKELTKKEIEDISTIQMIANYKLNLSILKKVKKDGIYTDELINILLENLKDNVVNILKEYNVDKISKDNPINEFKQDMEIREFLNKLQEEIGF